MFEHSNRMCCEILPGHTSHKSARGYILLTTVATKCSLMCLSSLVPSLLEWPEDWDWHLSVKCMHNCACSVFCGCSLVCAAASLNMTHYISYNLNHICINYSKLDNIPTMIVMVLRDKRSTPWNISATLPRVDDLTRTKVYSRFQAFLVSSFW